jgi:uncharacterized protein YbjT (DUF2867 family)
MPELIVLTCASGRQCSAIVPQLYADPRYSLRLVVNSESSRQRLSKQYPEAHVVQANLQVPPNCAKILEGATTIFYVGPPFHPYEVTFGMNIIDAAVGESKKPDSAFQHFIFSSALHPELTKLLHHHQKAQIEEYLTESGLQYTILQPSTFMDNFMPQLLGQKDSKGEKGRFMAPFSPDVPMSFSCVRDHAELAVKVIEQRQRHFYATYQVVSTLPMTLREYLSQVSRAMGKEFEIEKVPFEQASQMFTKITWGEGQDLGQEYKDAPERMLLYYNSRGLHGNPGVLEWLIGRKPMGPWELARLKLEKKD